MTHPHSETPAAKRLASVRRKLLLLILPLLVSPAIPGQAGAQAPPLAPAKPPWAAPQAMFEAMFGKESQVDQRLLAQIPVTSAEEQQIGQRAAAAYLALLRQQGFQVVQRGREIDYLRQLVKKVQPRMQNRGRYPTIHLYLALTDRCDARSFPGGYLVFFRGLLDSAENEAALIGIVGHELSHLDRGHHTRRIQEMKLAQQTFSRAGTMTMDQFFTSGTVLMRTWMRPFRIEYEREADLDGARWAYQTGYDCREMAKLFLRLQQRDGETTLPIPDFFRSHPAPQDRSQAIMQLYTRLQSDEPRANLMIGQESLRRRTPAAGKD